MSDDFDVFLLSPIQMLLTGGRRKKVLIVAFSRNFHVDFIYLHDPDIMRIYTRVGHMTGNRLFSIPFMKVHGRSMR